MSSRIEHYHEPSGPAANSLVPAASVAIVDERGRILMQRRRDSGDWALPGGTMNLGERIADTAVREAREETGLDVEVIGVVGMYTDPQHRIEYADGEVRQQFNICFRARIRGGTLAVSDESTDVRFVEPAELDEIPVHESTRLRLRHALEGRPEPYIG